MEIYLKLTKKLNALEKKLATFIKLNCTKLIRKTAYEITCLEGKIEAAKYTWNEDFSKVKNNSNGNTYKVSNWYCTCKSFFYKKGLEKGTCKHMRDRTSRLPVANNQLPKEFDLTVPAGIEIKRSDDWAALEYEIWAEQPTKQRFIGTILLNKFTCSAYPLKGVANDFDEVYDAATYLARRADLSLKQIKETAINKEWAERDPEYSEYAEYAF